MIKEYTVWEEQILWVHFRTLHSWEWKYWGKKFESMRGVRPFLVLVACALANYLCSTFQPLWASHTCKTWKLSEPQSSCWWFYNREMLYNPPGDPIHPISPQWKFWNSVEYCIAFDFPVLQWYSDIGWSSVSSISISVMLITIINKWENQTIVIAKRNIVFWTEDREREGVEGRSEFVRKFIHFPGVSRLHSMLA